MEYVPYRCPMFTEFNLGPPLACPTPFNLAAHVLGADVPADKVALIVGDNVRYSFGFLRNCVRAASAEYSASGVRPGDKVLLRLGNSERFPIAFLALCRIGAVPVITSSGLTTPELDRMAPQVQPRFMITDPGISVPTTCPPRLPAPDLEPVFEQGPPVHIGSPDRPGYIVFTSGTTAAPKAVVHAHRAVWARKMMWGDWYDLHKTDVLYHSGAFNWTFTLGTGLLDPWAIGATAVVAPDQAPTFATMQSQNVTIFAAAPGVYRNLLADPTSLPQPPAPALRHGLTAGDRLSPTLRDAWTQATNTPLLEAYGMTECSTFLSDRPGQDPGLHPQSGRRIALTDQNRIAIHKDDPGLMLGYLENGQPVLPLDKGWFVTQDVGQAKGPTIVFQARVGGLLNAGGFRISPAEIEDVMGQYPDIADVAAADIPVKDDVNVVGCFFTSDHDIDTDALNQFARARLAPYKQPRIFQRVPHLPKTANGKLDRRALPSLWR
ncbi:MAG: class I adenylate-forming enzyme family protein [Pseudomonadota bacterium]